MWGLDALSCRHCLGWSRPKEVVEKKVHRVSPGVWGELVGCRGKLFKLSFSIHSASLESPECLPFWKRPDSWSLEWKIMEKILGCNLSEASCRLYISRCITIFWRFISRFISYGLIFTIYSNIVLYHVDIIDIHVFLIHPWGR